MGAEETIEQWGPIWFLRIRRAGRSERCARLLEERGYEVTHLGTETSPGWSGTHRASHLVATPLC